MLTLQQQQVQDIHRIADSLDIISRDSQRIAFSLEELVKEFSKRH